MEMIALILILLAVFDVAVFLWGYDSRDGINSNQYELRQQWPASY